MNPKDSVGAKKAPTRYVPAALMLEVSAVMANGAVKYGPFNWREQPVSVMTYIEAMERHIAAYKDGQDNAEDSNLSHIAHVAASCGIILDAAASRTLLDDRVKGPAADILRRLDQSAESAPDQGALDPQTVQDMAFMLQVPDYHPETTEGWGALSVCSPYCKHKHVSGKT